MTSWTKDANDKDLKTTFIQGKKKQRKDFGSLSSLLKSMSVNDEMYKELSAQCRKADEHACVRKRQHK
jgi:hypothetical protein